VRLAFVVQRYGSDIAGGSEAHCRAIAHRLSPRHEITVLTTCAADYVTWANVYPAGESSDGLIGCCDSRCDGHVTCATSPT
jgi:hypothetical protein